MLLPSVQQQWKNLYALKILNTKAITLGSSPVGTGDLYIHTPTVFQIFIQFAAQLCGELMNILSASAGKI